MDLSNGSFSVPSPPRRKKHQGDMSMQLSRSADEIAWLPSMIFRLGLLMLFTLQYVSARQVEPALLGQTHHGIQRGKTGALYVDGINLAGTEKVVFNHPGLTARILRHRSLPYPPKEFVVDGAEVVRTEYLHDGSTKDRLKIELEAGPDVAPGIYRYRLHTPFGLTNDRRIVVGVLPEVREGSDNNSIETAQYIGTEKTVSGEISRSGDVDYFKIENDPANKTVLRIIAEPLQSSLDSVLRVWSLGGVLLEEADEFKGPDALIVLNSGLPKELVISVSDRLDQGGNGFHYRLDVGAFPVIVGTSPAGLVSGAVNRLKLLGVNLKNSDIAVGKVGSGWGTTQKIGVGWAVNPLELPVDQFLVVRQKASVEGQLGAQILEWPATIEGTIRSRNESGESHWFRFNAEKGERVVIEVNAQRHGSSLDSLIEVVDESGRLVPRAVVRCLAKTEMVLAKRTSKAPSFRIASSKDFAIHDLVMAAGEILEVSGLPRTPDDDIRFVSLGRDRMTLFDTTPEAHAIGQTIYKVKLLKPGTQVSSNGMPLFKLDFRNDDGGPALGRDSLMTFTAPDRGDYWIRLRDSRNQGGELFTYRMTVRPPTPDFRLYPGPVSEVSVNFQERNFYNLSPGGRTPIAVTAFRVDGFEGPITVEVTDLPPGVSATSGVIRPDSNFTTLVLSMEPDARFAPTPLRITGKAQIGTRSVERKLGKEGDLGLLSRTISPDLEVYISQKELTLSPNQEVDITVKVIRHGFEGRVPIQIVGLPPGVRAINLGLNGIIIGSDSSSQEVKLLAESWAKVRDLQILATARIESDAPLPIMYASPPIPMRILNNPEFPDGQSSGRRELAQR